MPEIRVTPLGAGQDVGRSCILVSISGKNVMLDCGMHMGYNDDRRFPDFSYITQSGRLTDFLDCVIISHFHLDHCGALPYFSEMVGYDGPIYMTHPTQAICPILLEDYRKIAVDKKGEANFFTSQMIKDCMKKVVAVHLHQTVQVDDELEIKAYYAGHVLGAAMFQIKVGSESVVYTGDYNMTPDRHLGAAWIDKCRPNLLITESTYATTIRDSKRCRERDFLKKVHETVERGGKVLTAGRLWVCAHFGYTLGLLAGLAVVPLVRVSGCGSCGLCGTKKTDSRVFHSLTVASDEGCSRASHSSCCLCM